MISRIQRSSLSACKISPEPRCVSVKRGWSMERPLSFKNNPSADLTSTVLGCESCRRVSVISTSLMHIPPESKEQIPSTDVSDENEETKLCRNQLDSIFKRLENNVVTLLKKELFRFKKLLSSSDPTCPEGGVEDEECCTVREMALNISLHVLKSMNQSNLANRLQNRLISGPQQTLKSKLRDKCERINEGISQSGSSVLLNEIYTELYITEGWSREINDEHEVRQIETASRRPATQEKPIKCNELFKDKSIRSVLTKGVAGIGKTVSVQKFILDWAERKANQDVMFIFPLPFRELNLMKGKNLSLMKLLHYFFPELKELEVLRCNSYKVVFIFDGLDECRLPLDFQNNEIVWDVTESASVDVLLTNLIKGNLLPSAFLWVTSRPGAANRIPIECVDLVTEVRGFSDPQKEEYFRKRISDQKLANQIITHMKSSRSLYIMCHLPVFCWISASVLERMLDEPESGEIPKTLTQMFTHFLIYQIKLKDQKYHGKYDLDPEQTRESILALGKLAFKQLEKGNLIFYEEDLKECGIDIREASVYSGFCTQIFREEFGPELGKVFSFVHLSFQEFLAALYVVLTFIIGNGMDPHTSDLFNKPNISELLKSAVNKALQSENGHLDVFLRFLLGLSLESNQALLRGLLPQTGISSHSKEEIVKYIKKKIRINPSVEKSINLFHCLNELNDQSLEQEVQTYLKRRGDGHLSRDGLSPAQWSALVFVLLNSEQELDEFDLRNYGKSEECFLKLLPVLKASNKAKLSHCKLKEKSCAALSSVLSSTYCSLKELDMSKNDLQDSGVKSLSAGLKDPHCELVKLSLLHCSLTTESCEVLSSVLSSESNGLKYLNLSENDLQDPGVKQLSVGLLNPHCKLEVLSLWCCNLTEKSCKVLSSVLSSDSTNLRALSLGENNLQDAGMKLLCVGLKNPLCKLETLELWHCNLTLINCEILSSVLTSGSSQLRELSLSENKIHDLGLKFLSAGLENPCCKLETLRVRLCFLTDKSCAILSRVLTSDSSRLRNVSLSENMLQDSGMLLLSAGLKDPRCKLEALILERCCIAEEGCTALASAVKSNPSSKLRELNLNQNNPGKAVKLLSTLMEDPHCNLKHLQMLPSRIWTSLAIHSIMGYMYEFKLS